jgi:hypothetical protein
MCIVLECRGDGMPCECEYLHNESGMMQRLLPRAATSLAKRPALIMPRLLQLPLGRQRLFVATL